MASAARSRRPSSSNCTAVRDKGTNVRMGQTTSDGTGSQAGGVAGSHPDPAPLKFNVAPATTDQSNTIHLPLNPVACWRVDDIRFAFDSSFVTSDITAEVKQLHDLREDHATRGGP